MKTKTYNFWRLRPANKKLRKQNGNMLALIAAITLGLVVALLFFGLNYSRLIGSNAEQKKAIEAAALAAATDISNIIIDTPEMGYVSLSDQAPIGKHTQAGDQFFLPVRGINTIIGTARLDAIIASQIPNSGVMSQLAVNDFTAAKAVLTKLNTVVNAAATGGAGASLAVDRDGTIVTPIKDAVAAYKQNVMRMHTSSYVNNSLKLTMGSLNTPSDTNIPISQPTSVENLGTAYVNNGNYRAFINIPFNGVNYVFGGIGNTPRLVDPRQFTTNLKSVAYQVPTIVKAECDEIIKTSQTPNGATFHTISCAQASSNFDPKPAPGAIAVEFPDGQVPEFQKPADLMSAKLDIPATVKTASGGDYPIAPTSALSPTPNPWPPNLAGAPTIASAWQVTLYDWIRRGGTKANISAVKAMVANNWGPAPPMIDWYAETTTTPGPLTNISTTYQTGGAIKVPMGIMHTYKWGPNGNILYKPSLSLPYPYEAVGENQLYAEVVGVDNGAFHSSMTPQIAFNQVKVPATSGIKGKVGTITGTIKGQVFWKQDFDIFVRDQVRIMGLTNGGKHGGEPMDNSLVTYKNGANTNRSGTEYGAGGSGAGGNDSGITGGGPNTSTTTDGTGKGTPPLISAESDFGDTGSNRKFSYPPPYVQYGVGPSGGGLRKTYQTTGITGSIRFRRQIQIDGDLVNIFGVHNMPSDMGYIGARVRANGTATYTTTDMAPTGPYPDIDIVDDFKDK